MRDNEILTQDSEKQSHDASIIKALERMSTEDPDGFSNDILSLIKHKNAVIERLQKQLKEGIDLSDDVFKIVKSKSYREFAERLKARSYEIGGFVYKVVDVPRIDYTLKELTEKNDFKE